jgi:hypothetical protein
MAEAQLNTTTNSGQQSATQNPQTAGQPALPGASSGSIQPGTKTDLLAGQGSIPLTNRPLTTVSLSPGAQVSSAPKPITPVAKPSFTPFLILAAMLLVLVAAASVVAINRTAKNTTN